MGKPIFLSPLFSTPAVVAGTGVAVLCTLYPQTANSYDPQHPGLNCVSPTNNAVNVYNAADVTAMGVYLVGQGVGRIVFDWETADTPGNRAVVLQILDGLRATGLRVDLWDVDVTGPDLADWKVAHSDDDIHVVSYPYRNDPALWLSNTGPFVASAAARYGRAVTLWIAPKSTAFPPGPPSPPPWGTYSEAALRTSMEFGRDTAEVSQTVVWWAPSAAGATAPWDPLDAAWAVIREYVVLVEATTALYDQLWAVLEAGASTPPLVAVGNRVKYAEVEGWLKELMHGQPADYPQIAIEVGRKGTHSAYEYEKTLAMQDPDFLESGEPFEIERTEQVNITLTTDQVVIGGINPLKEAVLDDLMRAGSRLGLKSLVVRFGPFTHEQRRVRVGEPGRQRGGQVTSINFPVVMLEDGRASLNV